jgi:hypothetical protein
MLMRSTGLGKTELVALIKDVKPQGDHLIMFVDTTEPVKWKIRCTLTLKDAKKLIAVCMKLSIMAFVCSFPRWFREPVHPGDF